MLKMTPHAPPPLCDTQRIKWPMCAMPLPLRGKRDCFYI
jgi:hypothetical protein